MAAGDERAGAAGVRVFLLIRDEAARQDVRRLLEHEGMQVVGEGDSARRAVARIGSLGPDVTVLDSGIVDGRGIQVCMEARESLPGFGGVVLATFGPRAGGPHAQGSGPALQGTGARRLPEAVRRAAARKRRAARPDPG
ncbi:hypothetical protein [Sinomonas atrocyanea]|uniref:hypothetical protein n=1 Tax=Sinomonas atrocyanea TaxID=37927 RepID=UPI0014714698|nr:hypothetical protein [Sinomonas atrocyanea]